MNRRNFFQATAASLGLMLGLGSKEQVQPELTVDLISADEFYVETFVAEEATMGSGAHSWFVGSALLSRSFVVPEVGRQITADCGIAEGRFEPGDLVCVRLLDDSSGDGMIRVDNIWLRVVGTRYRDYFTNGSASWLLEGVEEDHVGKIIPADTVLASFVMPERMEKWISKPLSA